MLIGTFMVIEERYSTVTLIKTWGEEPRQIVERLAPADAYITLITLTNHDLDEWGDEKEYTKEGYEIVKRIRPIYDPDEVCIEEPDLTNGKWR